jgi:DNA primase
MMCHCWVCGLKGKTPYYIIKKFCGDSKALDFKSKFGIKTNDNQDDIIEEEVVSFPSEFTMLATVKDAFDPDVRACLSYLRKRGVSKELMWRHKVGIFRGKKWSRRVVFPSFDSDGDLNFFVSRAIDKDGFPKYLNCNADKTKIIFDEMRIDWKKELTIVEGVFDLVRCDFNSTCLLGSSLNQNHALFQKIIKNQTPVVLALDADMIDKSYNIARTLSSFGVRVKLLEHGDYHDVGEMSSEIVRQKCNSAPIYSRESRLQHLIGTISSGSIF